MSHDYHMTTAVLTLCHSYLPYCIYEQQEYGGLLPLWGREDVGVPQAEWVTSVQPLTLNKLQESVCACVCGGGKVVLMAGSQNS